MDLHTSEVSQVFSELSPEVQNEIKLARKCWVALERLTNLMLGYPPGHPIIEGAAEEVAANFLKFFHYNDRLSVMLQSHTMQYLGTSHAVWETVEPKDYVWVLSRDGVFLMHFLAGITTDEIMRFVEVCNALVDERNLEQDAVTLLFKAEFRYISFDAVDESMAQLANVELDIRDRDTSEEQEQIDDLFDGAFDEEKQQQKDSTQQKQQQDQDFQIRMNRRSEHQQRMVMGSRQFLELSNEAQQHLLDLKRGFSDHAELEHREGELLAAILGARPKAGLVRHSVKQVSEVMGTLLETNAPWESLEFLKLIHAWRDALPPETTTALKHEVTECFTSRRLGSLTKMVVGGDTQTRRSILQMFNALNLDEATVQLTHAIGWDLEPETQLDILRYLKEQSRHGLGFIEAAIFDIPPEKTEPLLQLLQARLPTSMPILKTLVQRPSAPEIKAFAINALAGTWTPDDIPTTLVPCLELSHEGIRLAALRAIANTDSDQAVRIVSAMFDNTLSQRGSEEIREIAEIYVRYGGPSAITKIKSLIQVKGMIVSESDINLAINLATMLARNPNPQIISILVEVSKDWRAPAKIRSTCKELSELLQR